MTSEEQTEANQENAKKSTGPTDCNKTRFNAVRFGLSGKAIYSEEDEIIVCQVYDSLCEYYDPNDIVEKIIIARMAKIIWRLQRVTQIEQGLLVNSIIRQENYKKNPIVILDRGEKPKGYKDELTFESLNEDFDLVTRYETTLENRLLKLIRFLQQKRQNFK